MALTYTWAGGWFNLALFRSPPLGALQMTGPGGAPLEKAEP